jgi:hypothetical protein
MAVMEPVTGLQQFLTVLAELRFGQREGYPFYCALLYTVAAGLDADLARYVDEHEEELDAMTGDRCLVFRVGDVRAEPAAGHRPFATHEVYRIAELLGVSQRSLPCAVFFAEPDASRELLTLRLASFVRAEPTGETSAQTLNRAFRGIATALDDCSRLPVDERLACLRASLRAEHERLGGREAPPTVGERIQDAGATAEAAGSIITLGTTIAVAAAKAFGIVF